MAQRRKLRGEAMTRLNEREREILIERRLRDEPLTLEDLSRRFHVSRERIRQLEVRAVDSLQRQCWAPPRRSACRVILPQPSIISVIPSARRPAAAVSVAASGRATCRAGLSS